MTDAILSIRNALKTYGETNAPGPKGSKSVWQNGTLVPVAQTKGVAGRDKRLPMRWGPAA